MDMASYTASMGPKSAAPAKEDAEEESEPSVVELSAAELDTLREKGEYVKDGVKYVVCKDDDAEETAEE